jgi:metal-responsive CopG/Arc/MetJ family transcriptional regulator
VKTAISIPDDLFLEADLAAQRLGLSRSELYARAVARFVEAARASNVTAALDRVYAREDAAVDPVLGELQERVAKRERWR